MVPHNSKSDLPLKSLKSGFVNYLKYLCTHSVCPGKDNITSALCNLHKVMILSVVAAAKNSPLLLNLTQIKSAGRVLRNSTISKVPFEDVAGESHIINLSFDIEITLDSFAKIT